jgi:hypothetical protein
LALDINTVSEKFPFDCMLKLLLAANSKHIVTGLDYQHLPTYDIKVQELNVDNTIANDLVYSINVEGLVFTV